MRRPLAWLLAGALLVAAPASAQPTLPLGHAGRWITDAAGRVVILHGINMVYKVAPYYPAAAGFDDDDAAFLHSAGFNAVRVGVIWKGLESRPGGFNDGYVAQIRDTVGVLSRHGIVSLLDFHQDMFNERFQGEGAPDWAVQDGGLPNPQLGFPGNYLGNLALDHALDQFYANAAGPNGVGLADRFAAAWAHVAGLFAGNPDLLGYEILNEPFPGTLWETCASVLGCPASDAKLEALYRRVETSIRGVDSQTLIWYEPNPLFNFGFDTGLPALGDATAGFAFHDYCLVANPTGCTSEATTFANAVAHVSRTHEALLMTEFGSTNAVADLEGMVARADANMVPWLEWAYCGCSDPTTSGPGNIQAIVIDPSKPPTGSNVIEPTLRALVEPYPQVIAGTPTSWGYQRTSNQFSLSFTTARASGGGAFAAGTVSEIAVPALDYPTGYAANASGAAVVSRPGSPTLALASCPHAGRVTVTVVPSGASTGSCRAQLRLSVSPRRFPAGRKTTFGVRVSAVLGAFSEPVAGATVVLAGKRVRTGAAGRARIRIRLGPRRYLLVARAPGFSPGRARVSPR